MKCIALSLLALMGVALGDLQGTVGVPAGDPQMNAAFAQARRETSSFIAALQAKSADSYYVKVKIVDGGEVEYFWLRDIAYTDGVFHGTIDDEPEHVHNVKDGQKYDVKREDIFDWLYMKNGKMYGNYTLRATLPRLSPGDAAKARAMLAP